MQQSDTPFAIIAHPTGLAGLTANEAVVQLAGPAYADRVVWSTDRGESGESSGQGGWSAEVPLQPGDNVVVVTAESDDATNAVGTTDRITITYNPHLRFKGLVSMSPNVARVGEPVEVTVRVGIHVDEHLLTSSVRVVTVDEDNSVTGDLVPLTDDGDPANGDTIAGDGVFSGTYTFNESAEGVIRLRVAAQTATPGGTVEGLSEVFAFEVVEPLTQADASRMESFALQVEATYDAIKQTDGRVEAARQTAQRLLSQPGVLHAGSSNDGYALWWELELRPGVTVEQGMGGGRPGTNSHPTLNTPAATVIEPFYAEWQASGNAQIADFLGGEFDDTWCPKLHPITLATGPSGNVQEFKEMNQYGLIAINSHGWLWGSGASAKATIYTEEVAFPHEFYGSGKYAIDVKKKWLQTWTHKGVLYYVVTPAFVHQYHRGGLNGAVVFNSSCHGLNDSSNKMGGSLSWAFVKNGAGVYMGFTGAVGNTWGGRWSKSFFGTLVEGSNVEESIDYASRLHGIEEPGNPGVRFRMIPSRKDDYRKLQVSSQCDGYMNIKHRRIEATGFVLIEKSELRSTSSVTLSPWMEGFYSLTKEEAECKYRREEYSTGLQTSDEEGAASLTEFYGDPEGGVYVDGTRLRLCIDHVSEKVYLNPVEQFTDTEWVTYDLTTYPLFGMPGGTSSSQSNCRLPSVLVAAMESPATGACAAFGGALMLAFDVPTDAEIGEDYVVGRKVFDTLAGTATVEFAYRLRE